MGLWVQLVRRPECGGWAQDCGIRVKRDLRPGCHCRRIELFNFVQLERRSDGKGARTTFKRSSKSKDEI